MSVRRAVLVPGRVYDTRAPLFAYLGEALRRVGYDVHEISWEVPEEFAPWRSGPGEAAPWVAEQVGAALREPTDLLVGKSLGTLAAPLAAAHSIRAVWLTPLLDHSDVIGGLGRATAPFLLVGGTADQLWVPETARRLTPHLVEVPDADHSMLVPGPLARSAEVLGRICTAVEEFAA